MAEMQGRHALKQFVRKGGATGITVDGCTFQKVDGNDTDSHAAKSTRKAMDRMKPLLTKTFSVEAGICPECYKYTLRICSQVQQKGKLGGLLQKKLNTHEDPAIIGQIENADIKGGKDWIMLEYSNGDNYGSHCSKSKRHALIMITCMRGEKKGKFSFVEENQDKLDDCYYLFDLAHEAACTAVPKKLSTGSILLIVFACVAGVYLLVGVIFQRVTAGAKGIDQIPNLGFWLNFGSLTADGCDLACRCKSQGGSNVYRGVDDIGGSTPDSVGTGQDADEHLLPM
ncbi:hypothetical protein LSAT2_013482 [Lamellibrachia satsuma]|nr:hypothetical protein LSAT2_013482 [Lamellibrachia satsuma]